MLPIALVVGTKAETWGRKPILLVGFIILPIPALLYTLSGHATWLIGVQLLDGVGAGVLSVLTPPVVADLSRGAGRYNFALGAVTTAQGVGASLSGLVAGVIVDRLGYSAAFVGMRRRRNGGTGGPRSVRAGKPRNRGRDEPADARQTRRGTCPV